VRRTRKIGRLVAALVVLLWSLGLFVLLKALTVLRVPAASEGIGEQDIQCRLVAALVVLLWPLRLFWGCCCCIRRHR
jgi:hypothetical protein